MRTLGVKEENASGENPVSPPRIEHHLSDEALVARILQGDTWAKEAMYRRHVAQAYRVARRLLTQPADTEDVVQEAFIQALSDLPHLREPSRLRVWLLKIVVHRAHRKFRRRKWLSLFGDGDKEEWGGIVAHGSCPPEVAAELALARRLLSEQSYETRAAWILRRVEGCSLLEVSEACSCSLATAKRRITRVDQELKRHLGEGANRGD